MQRGEGNTFSESGKAQHEEGWAITFRLHSLELASFNTPSTAFIGGAKTIAWTQRPPSSEPQSANKSAHEKRYMQHTRRKVERTERKHNSLHRETKAWGTSQLKIKKKKLRTKNKLKKKEEKKTKSRNKRLQNTNTNHTTLFTSPKPATHTFASNAADMALRSLRMFWILLKLLSRAIVSAFSLACDAFARSSSTSRVSALASPALRFASYLSGGRGWRGGGRGGQGLIG